MPVRSGRLRLAGARQRLARSLQLQNEHSERVEGLPTGTSLRTRRGRAVCAMTELLAQESGQRAQLRYRGVEQLIGSYRRHA